MPDAAGDQGRYQSFRPLRCYGLRRRKTADLYDTGYSRLYLQTVPAPLGGITQGTVIKRNIPGGQGLQIFRYGLTDGAVGRFAVAGVFEHLYIHRILLDTLLHQTHIHVHQVIFGDHFTGHIVQVGTQTAIVKPLILIDGIDQCRAVTEMSAARIPRRQGFRIGVAILRLVTAGTAQCSVTGKALIKTTAYPTPLSPDQFSAVSAAVNHLQQLADPLP